LTAVAVNPTLTANAAFQTRSKARGHTGGVDVDVARRRHAAIAVDDAARTPRRAERERRNAREACPRTRLKVASGAGRIRCACRTGLAVAIQERHAVVVELNHLSTLFTGRTEPRAHQVARGIRSAITVSRLTAAGDVAVDLGAAARLPIGAGSGALIRHRIQLALHRLAFTADEEPINGHHLPPDAFGPCRTLADAHRAGAGRDLQMTTIAHAIAIGHSTWPGRWAEHGDRPAFFIVVRALDVTTTGARRIGFAFLLNLLALATNNGPAGRRLRPPDAFFTIWALAHADRPEHAGGQLDVAAIRIAAFAAQNATPVRRADHPFRNAFFVIVVAFHVVTARARRIRLAILLLFLFAVTSDEDAVGRRLDAPDADFIIVRAIADAGRTGGGQLDVTTIASAVAFDHAALATGTAQHTRRPAFPIVFRAIHVVAAGAR